MSNFRLPGRDGRFDFYFCPTSDVGTAALYLAAAARRLHSQLDDGPARVWEETLQRGALYLRLEWEWPGWERLGWQQW